MRLGGRASCCTVAEHVAVTLEHRGGEVVLEGPAEERGRRGGRVAVAGPHDGAVDLATLLGQGLHQGEGIGGKLARYRDDGRKEGGWAVALIFVNFFVGA